MTSAFQFCLLISAFSLTAEIEYGFAAAGIEMWLYGMWLYGMCVLEVGEWRIETCERVGWGGVGCGGERSARRDSLTRKSV